MNDTPNPANPVEKKKNGNNFESIWQVLDYVNEPF